MARITKKDQERLDKISQILKENLFQLKKLDKEKASKAFQRSCATFDNARKKAGHPFKPEYNAVYWACELINMAREMFISYCWMEAHAIWYKKNNPPGQLPSDSSTHVSFYADNCATLIDSFRDKLALMVYSLYCSFNPEIKDEILIYEDIVKRLKKPGKFDLNIKNQKPFLNYLEKLNKPHFKIIKDLRNLKIHRLSPRIELYQTGPHQYDYYMLPLTDSKEKSRWREKLFRQYNNNLGMAQRIEKGCYVDGILYDRRPLKGRLFEYNKVNKNLKLCLLDSMLALSKCLNLLRRRVL